MVEAIAEFALSERQLNLIHPMPPYNFGGFVLKYVCFRINQEDTVPMYAHKATVTPARYTENTLLDCTVSDCLPLYCPDTLKSENATKPARQTRGYILRCVWCRPKYVRALMTCMSEIG